MKKILMTITLLLMGKMSFSASTGLLFNVRVNGATYIFTPKANNAYSDIGMLITSPNYSFSTPTTQCSRWPNTNGYCKFPASSTSPASVSINGPVGVMNFILCLNLSGKLSCQHYDINTFCTSMAPVVSTAFSGTNIEFGRLSRNSIPSTCQGKAYPGIFGTSTQYYYQTFTYHNPTSSTQCVTVNFDPNSGSGTPCGANAHASAYLNSYDPNNIQNNYVGDVGSSVTQPFSFNIPGNTDYVIVVTNTNSLSTCGFGFSITPPSLACSRS